MQVQTATLIMYSNKIYFPQRHSPEWKDFVRVSLEKNPHLRPSATTLLNHPWIRCAYKCCIPWQSLVLASLVRRSAHG